MSNNEYVPIEPGTVYNTDKPEEYYSDLEEARNNKPEPEYPAEKYVELAKAAGVDEDELITNRAYRDGNKHDVYYKEELGRNDSNPKKPYDKKGGEKISQHL